MITESKSPLAPTCGPAPALSLPSGSADKLKIIDLNLGIAGHFWALDLGIDNSGVMDQINELLDQRNSITAKPNAGDEARRGGAPTLPLGTGSKGAPQTHEN